MNVARDIAEESQEDVDEEVTGATSQETNGCGREEYGDEDEENVRSANHVR